MPSFDDVINIIRPADGSSTAAPGLEAFRSEFQQLLESDELSNVRRVVVLVDDLDRCLHETVIETLEAIRLFLAVPKMSFVLAADEQRVAEAIRTRFEQYVPSDESPEEPAALYLHKIVQTTVPIPALSRFDTEAYLVLLQILARLNQEQRAACVEACAELRRTAGELDELAAKAGHDIGKELLFAARLTPILYEKLRGNPRRVKRFLNDLNIRQSVAAKRGIELGTARSCGSPAPGSCTWSGSAPTTATAIRSPPCRARARRGRLVPRAPRGARGRLASTVRRRRKNLALGCRERACRSVPGANTATMGRTGRRRTR